jgi:hypothetical protein
VQAVAFSMAQREQLVAVVAEHLEVLGQAGLADRGEIGVAGTDAGDRQRVGGVGLARSAQPTPFADRQRARDLAHIDAGVGKEAGQGGAEVGATLDTNPGDGGVLVEPGGELPVADRGVGEAGGGLAAASGVDQAGRQGVFVAVDPAEQLDHLRGSRDDARAARRHASG